MRWSDNTGGKAAKTQRRKTLKRRNAPKAAQRGSSLVAGKETNLARLTRERDEALEQQRATAGILRVIRASPTDVQPVFETIVRNAVSLCGGLFANVFRFDGELLHFVASHNVGPSIVDMMREKYPMRPDSSQVSGRVLRTKSVVWLEDALADPDYDQRFPRAMGWRRLLGVPMLRDGEPIGVIGVGWAEPGPASKVQEELLKTFADQAVIAIENTRLLNELRQRTDDLSEALEQQTATSEVLRVISSSPGELEPVFEAMLANATRICEAKFGFLWLAEGDGFRAVAMHDVPSALAEERHYEGVIHFSPDVPLGRVALTKQLVHVADIRDEPGYAKGFRPIVRLADTGGARTLVAVPMHKDNDLVGAIIIYRQEIRPFTDKQIELVKNFAAQAVIAIENTRLLSELHQRTTDLSKSLEDLRSAQDRLVQTEKLASLGQLTAGIAHEIKNPLNFVNNFSVLSSELIDELQDALKDMSLSKKRRSEITELMSTLRANLEKVVQHGKRADAIVKNMLLHSRAGSGEHRPVDINAIVEESLNLAWHGARAEKQGFNITMERSLDPTAGEVDVFPQDITRVLLNLISNGFYAATKRKAEANGGDYEPTLAAATKNLGDRVEIRIRDNGTGIPPEVKERLFTPFFTTKPAGEGTGLGLSISHDIIVKQHCGSIEVDTQPGEFTEIRIVLPRAAVVP
ncbi:MAG TPA: GAF domain-containing protein [Pseudolabrys sp.]|nr:GAF domain-containing protein [Pseudolabrys sp.]